MVALMVALMVLKKVEMMAVKRVVSKVGNLAESLVV